MDVNNRKVRMYRFSYSHRRLIWLLWWGLFGSILLFYLALLRTRIVAPHALWPTRLFYTSATVAILVLLAFTPLLLFSGMFDVRFRYVAWWTARAAGVTRRWLLTGWRSAVLLLAGVALAMLGISRLKLHRWQWQELLTATFAVRAVTVSVLISTLLWAYRARKRMVILPFMSYASDDRVKDKDDKVKDKVEGIATLLLSQLAYLTQLYVTIDEMVPEATRKGKNDGEQITKATVNVQDVGEDLQGMISGESKVRLGLVELPVGALMGVVGRIVQGPRITGSLHKEGNSMTLVASLTGGDRNRNWQVRSGDLDKGRSTEDSTLRSMIEQMAYRIFTDLVETGSASWRAVRCHSRGLRSYRDQSNTLKDKELNLRRAERAFIQALAEDNEFARNHYNLGIVYKEKGKGETHAAKIELQKVTEIDPHFWEAYYALANIAKGEYRYDDVLRLCDQVICLQPDSTQAWSLRGLACRYESELGQKLKAGDPPQVWARSIESRALSAALAWRALCHAEWTGTHVGEAKSTAQDCLLALAVACAIAAPDSHAAAASSPIFYQARYLDSTNAEIHIQMAMVLQHSRQNRQAADSYKDALRIREDFLLWLNLAKVQATLYSETEDEKDKAKDKQDAMTACQKAMSYAWEADEETLKTLGDAYTKLGEKEFSDRLQWVLPLRSGKHCPAKVSKEWDWAYAQKAIWTGSRCSWRGKFALAQKCLQSAIGKLSDWEIRERTLYVDLANYCKDEGKLDEALKNAKDAIERNPMGIVENRLLAGIYHALGDYERAESEWQICLDIRPDDPESLEGIAYTYWERGVLIRCSEERRKVFTRVIEIFDQTLELSEEWETRASTHYWLGRFHADLRNYDQAFYHFNVAKSMGFKPLETRVQLGLTYTEAKAFDDAEDTFREALVEVERYKKGGGERSKYLNDTEDKPVEDLLGMTYVGLAMTFAERRVNLKEALGLVERASELIAQAEQSSREEYQPESYQHECLGLIYLHDDAVDKAIEEFEKAIAVRVGGLFDDGGVYYHLALAYMAQAQSKSADSAQSLTRVRERCVDASRASVRDVYSEEISKLPAKLDALEASLAAPQPSLYPAASKAA